MTIEETLVLADRFWIGSGYMQHLHPNKKAYLERVTEMRSREVAAEKKDVQREVGTLTMVQTA